MVSKEKGAWKYGQVMWLGVSPSHQRRHVGQRLYKEMERRMTRQGVRMILMDTASANAPAIEFFRRMGFANPRYQVWMSKITRPSKRGRRKVGGQAGEEASSDIG
jgi:GNAT superfamily N-acetyltransferase